jgi:hypothetical protein
MYVYTGGVTVQAGKTTVSNLIGNDNIADNSSVRPPYHPTHSVRIVEYPLKVSDTRQYNMDVEVQLWEVGGDPK